MALEVADARPIAPSVPVQGIQGARDVQLYNSSINVVGRDNHTHTHFHYHEVADKLKTILDAVSNFREIQQDTLAKATPGTILWLLQCKEFRLFVDIDGKLKILWGSGMPGAGKTILASIVINKLEALARASNGQICVAYAYIRYSDQDQITVRGILESLIKQTVERHPDCVALAQQMYDAHIQEGTRPAEDELLTLLEQFTQLKRATFYVLDALDEAPTGIRLKLLQKLSSLGMRLFVTSRPLPALEAKFPGAHTFPIVAQDHDLDLHIAEKISDSEDLQDLLEQCDPAFKAYLISTVKAKCGGMFLHASLQLNALKGCFTVHDVKRILEGFPQSIEDVYQQTWSRIAHSEPHHLSLAKAAFVWVLCAQQPMSFDELRHALATCPDKYHFDPGRLMPEAVILAICRGLLTVDRESKLVRLVHYTAKGVLEGLLLDSIPHPHSLLAAICVTRLADCGFQNTTITSKRELDEALEADHLLRYSYQAWAFHTHESLNADLTMSIVSAFIMGCEAFPLVVGRVYSYRNFDRFMPLHLAAFYNLPFAYAGSPEADRPNILSTRRAMTPLHLACVQGHYAAAQKLVCQPDTLVNFADYDGWTALMFASMYGDEAIVKLLLAHPGLEPHLASKRGRTAWGIALASGHKGIVKLLAAHPGVNINLPNKQGRTALMTALEQGAKDTVELLLTCQDVEVNCLDKDGWTALLSASCQGNEGIVMLLLYHPEILVNLTTDDGWTALMLACKNRHKGIVKLLLAHPQIQVNLTSNDGLTALMRASWSGHEGIVKLLLAHPQILVNLADSDGWTALMRASSNGRVSTVKLLLAHPDIDVNMGNPHGSSSLLLAAQYGHTPIVELLLAAPEIIVNPIDGDGDTAIKIAADQGREDAVHRLLEALGIDTSAVSTTDGHTAMSVAVANGHHEIVRLLQQFEATRAAM